jgi:hypothetical protein
MRICDNCGRKTRETETLTKDYGGHECCNSCVNDLSNRLRKLAMAINRLHEAKRKKVLVEWKQSRQKKVMR